MKSITEYHVNQWEWYRYFGKPDDGYFEDGEEALILVAPMLDEKSGKVVSIFASSRHVEELRKAKEAGNETLVAITVTCPLTDFNVMEAES